LTYPLEVPEHFTFGNLTSTSDFLLLKFNIPLSNIDFRPELQVVLHITGSKVSGLTSYLVLPHEFGPLGKDLEVAIDISHSLDEVIEQFSEQLGTIKNLQIRAKWLDPTALQLQLNRSDRLTEILFFYFAKAYMESKGQPALH
jgi:hypothetical protein